MLVGTGRVTARLSLVSAVAVAATLIITPPAHAGITGLVSGNTAERILKQIDCSILAVKPEGFSSPLEV